jgi:hypothetical protein
MALSAAVQKTLVMKPEVEQIFADLEEWLDHCRMELIEFNPKHLYKSPEYKEWARNRNKKVKTAKRSSKRS